MTALRVLLIALLWPIAAAGGIDHKEPLDESGIWSRSNQKFLEYGSIVANVGVAVWEGGDTRLGRNAWQSVDSMALSGVVANVAKPVFGRKRPRDTEDPNEWRSGGKSFPSGEVASISGIVTPYILEYRHDQPAVYALELLPLYDGIARIKSQAHWQTDVLAGFAIGTASGYYAYNRDSPFILNILPHGVSVGVRTRF